MESPDLRALRFDWNNTRAFLVTAETGSLSAAARALGMGQPTLSRQVAALEAELGVALFDRVPRGLRLTEAGLRLVAHARAMGAAAERVSLAATGQAQTLEGNVAITASELVAAYLLPPALAVLRARAPGLTLEIIAANEARDLRRREADIALRSFRPDQPDLVARKLRDVEVGLYATPGHAAQLADPDDPAALARATFIGYDNGPALARALAAIGLEVAPDRFRLISPSHLVAWEMVRAGLGIGIMSVPIADRDPGVTRLGRGLKPLTWPLWLCAHAELRSSARIRMVFDTLAAHL